MQSVFSWAPKVVRKCESKHWFSCGADSRSGGRSVFRCTVTWLPNFLGWVHLVSYGALLWPPKHQASTLSTELWRTHGERGHILGSYLTRILHTARISNVKIILYGKTMKAGKREDKIISMSRAWDVWLLKVVTPIPWIKSIYTMMWMLRVLWLVVAHDLLEYTYMDDVTGNLISLFSSTT